jgi:hypothetical protein
VGDAADGTPDVLRAQDDVRVDRRGIGQRKTPTPEREGRVSLGAMTLCPLVEAGTLRSLAASRDRFKGRCSTVVVCPANRITVKGGLQRPNADLRACNGR